MATKKLKNLPLSFIEISERNLIHNVKQFLSLLKKGTQISAVVKANAYGHGDIEVVKILAPEVDYFQVDGIEELTRIRPFTKKPIFVFGYVAQGDLEKAIKLDCILAVFSFEQMLKISATAKKLNKKQKVHIALDAYLGREGFLPSEIGKLLPEIKKMPNIIIDGIYAHFADIEDIHPDKSFAQDRNFSHAQKQIDAYQKVCEVFKHSGYKNLKTHISATSGVLVYEKSLGLNSIVRIGIGLYGLWPSEYLEKMWNKKITLKPVLRWVTHVAQIKTLPAGHSIGYGLTYITKRTTKVAVIPQGYADGYDRGFSNNGEVLIGGTKCKILGRVMMNMFVVDVTHLENVKTEDEVVLIGEQGNKKITAEDLAQRIDTINYEITTRISPLLPRIAL